MTRGYSKSSTDSSRAPLQGQGYHALEHRALANFDARINIERCLPRKKTPVPDAKKKATREHAPSATCSVLFWQWK